MPTITLQVGQCGNQVGQQLWSLISQQYDQDSNHAHCFLRYSTAESTRKARCLLIDTEPKVIAALAHSSTRDIFLARNAITSQSGRGNNWAFGYSSSATQQAKSARSAAAQSPDARNDWVSPTKNERPDIVEEDKVLSERIFDAIRAEAEDCDGAPDFLLIHSLAGGTGSGLGSRILEDLRHEYPLNSIATLSVAPHTAGDTALQALNTTMSLSFLQAYADAVLLFENADVLNVVQGSQTPAGPGGRPRATGASSSAAIPQATTSMADINAYIARQALGALWPLTGLEACGGMSRIRDIVQTVTPDPCMKFVETRTSTANPDSLTMLPDAVRSINRHLRKYHEDGHRVVSATSTLVLARGFSVDSLTSRTKNDDPLQAFRKACNFYIPPDLPGQLLSPLKLRAAPVGLAGMASKPRSRPDSAASASSSIGSGSSSRLAAQPCLSVVSNRSTAVDLLRSTSEKAMAMCSAGAYVHWFKKYGCPSEAILHAAEQLADVADYYSVQHGMQLPDADG